MAASTLVGRDAEVATLRTAVENAVAGQGGVALVEGEPGIGKSTLAQAGIAPAAGLGCRVLWSTCDELAMQRPLGALLDSLTAPEAAEIQQPPDGQTAFVGDPVVVAAERCLALIDHLCAASPVVWVLDDLQWADEPTLLVWGRLARAVHQLPMLLIGVARPVPHRREVNRLRRTLLGLAPIQLALDPLPAEAVGELLATLLGQKAGAGLSSLAQQAAGNPLYLRELVESLRQEKLVDVTAGCVELVRPAEEVTVPASLAAMVADRLTFLSAPTTEMLRLAAVLGTEFSASELATVTDAPATDLLGLLDEAIAAQIVVERGNRLAFRHPLIRRALYSAVPADRRVELHRRVARALADAGVAVERIADQLLAEPEAGRDWALDWIAEHAAVLSWRSPRVAADLIGRAVGEVGDNPNRMPLEIARAKLSEALTRQDQAQESARWVLAHTTDSALLGDMTWTLARSQQRAHLFAECVATLQAALRNNRLPRVWHARLTAELSLALVLEDKWESARSAATEALVAGERANDRMAIGYALHTLCLVHAKEHRYAEVIAGTSRALETIGEHPDTVDLHQLLLLIRATGRDQMDETAAAEVDVQAATALADRTGTARQCTVYAVAAELLYEGSRWDDALAMLETIEDQLMVTGSEYKRVASFFHGTRALIAAHRDDEDQLRADLDAVRSRAPDSAAWLMTSLAAVQARAIALERDGRTAKAVTVLADCLVPGSPLSSRPDHDRVLPTLVRLALDADQPDIARQAADYAASLAARTSPLPRAKAIAQHCRGLLEGDPELLSAAAEYFGRTKRLLHSGQCFEDAAVVLASAGRPKAGRFRFANAVEIYLSLGASWDLRRAEHRLSAYGVRRGARARQRRPDFGWEALTVTELKIAGLVGLGMSNPAIANELVLSRRTVQTHVSHILAKLKASSRIEIAREAARQEDASDDSSRNAG